MSRCLTALRCWLLAGAVAALAHAETAPRPNIVVIFADDLGYGDTSTYRPDGDVRTPAIDRLAADGMRFTAMRANATVCSPSRAALMTGRYADRVGVPGLIRSNFNTWGYLDPTVPTLADLLREAGYHTALVGKWNLGLTPGQLPNDRGFDHFHGFLDDMMDSYTTHLRRGVNFMRLNREEVRPEGHATAVFSDWAIDYFEDRAAPAHRDEPFFLYLAYTAPHYPLQPPPEALARVQARAPEMPEQRALNVALVEDLDTQIGRVMDTLRATGLADNTLVFVTSDNGGALNFSQNNDPWRGGKRDHYDGGLRVPFVATWPAHVAAGTESDYVGLVFDIFVTALEEAGAEVPAGLDAQSLGPALRGEAPTAAENERQLYFVRREGERYGGKTYEALIRGDWKLMQNDPFSPLELYNLKEDPLEQHDRMADEPELAKELTEALALEVQQAGAVPWQAPAKP
ncbi:sulfatase family protein [Actomonas aquatica]|uniref:Sulfatase-like hydrolase/transferase n=1 Tax=Actomonas aquatica TaxID=2866162 RepID=A0ABZ1C265_9BACT|nr:sulfatase-like hydrolase/transferase [Opitutus sp. WL0086]WRQ85754.1 sulfatase-like hydrolase/transferase [Opitutus sp. WL0086]